MEKKMKKLALSVILGASLVISSSAFALTSMTDASMKSATAQSGVSIAIDNVVIESFVGATTYTDDDGTTTGDTGSITISNRHTIKKYLALTSATDFAADFLAEAGVAATGTWTAAHALSIDVGTCPVLTAGAQANGLPTTAHVTGVVIGLPTLLINTSADSYSITASGSAGSANAGAKYITITTTGSTMAILGGTVEIAPH
jgi:hypothetical protein